MEKRRTEWVIPVLLALGAAAALAYYWIQASRQAPERVVPPEPPPAEPEPAAVSEPLHPVPQTESTSVDMPELVPLPPLERSDEYFKLALDDLFGGQLEEMLVDSRVIERIVATIDNLPRDRVAQRIRPVAGIDGTFAVDTVGDDGEFRISNDNYDRYDPVVDLLTGADLEAVAEVYRRFYPLFQKAYVDLGYPDGYFNDRLVEVIDHLLATPETEDGLPLVRPHVLYEYADPELEGLSSGQKLLLRMGSEHRMRIKEKLREFRSTVTRL